MTPKNTFLLLFLIGIMLISCKSNQQAQSTLAPAGMYKVTIFYPNSEGSTFDMEYYKNKHMPMVAGFIGKNLKFYEIDMGISGRTPTDKIPFVAIGYFYIDDVGQYNNAIAQHRDAIVSDFKKYTNIQPVIQISEIKHLGRTAAK